MNVCSGGKHFALDVPVCIAFACKRQQIHYEFIFKFYSHFNCVVCCCTYVIQLVKTYLKVNKMASLKSNLKCFRIQYANVLQHKIRPYCSIQRSVFLFPSSIWNLIIFWLLYIRILRTHTRFEFKSYIWRQFNFSSAK